MKITKEKDNSKSSFKQEKKEDFNNVMNNSKSKMSDSFCNLTDSQNIEMEEAHAQGELNMQNFNNNKINEEYDFYFKSDHKKEEKSDDDEYNDLENFYENRQSRIEQEILRRSSVSKQTSNLNSIRKDSSRLSLTPKVNTNRPVTPIEKEKSVISHSKNLSNNKENKLMQSVTSLKSQVQIENKRNTVNVISYDEFKFKNVSSRPGRISGSNTPLDTSRVSISRDMATKNVNSNKNIVDTKKRSASEIKNISVNKNPINKNENKKNQYNDKISPNSNATKFSDKNKKLISGNSNKRNNSVTTSKNHLNVSNMSYTNKNTLLNKSTQLNKSLQSSKSKSPTNKKNNKNINLKLKITHDTVEDITITEESSNGPRASRQTNSKIDPNKKSPISKSRSRSKSDYDLLNIHKTSTNHVQNHENQKTLFNRKESLQVTNQQYINSFRKNTAISLYSDNGNIIQNPGNFRNSTNISNLQTIKKQPVALQVPLISQDRKNLENAFSTFGSSINLNHNNILISEAKSDFEKEIIQLKSTNEKLDKEVKPLIEKHRRESSKKSITCNKIFEFDSELNMNTLPNEAITISDLQVENQDPHSRNDKHHLSVKDMNTDSLSKSRISPCNTKRVSQLFVENSNNPIPSKECNTRKMTLQSEVLTKGHVDQNYEDEYKQIYVKRRATRTITNTEETEERKRKFFDDLYHRNVNWKKNLVDKFSNIKEEFAEEELKKCSFTPKLSRSSEKILSKSMTYANYDKEDFYNKNIKWKQQVEKFKQTQHLINERKEYEECFFQPVIKKPLLTETTENSTKRDQDHIYKKNIEWLRKVNENKKLRHLEMKEEMKLKGRRESIRDRMARSKSTKNLMSNNTIQSDQNNINLSNSNCYYNFSEEKSKNDLLSSRSTLRLPISPKSPNTFRSDMMTSNVFSSQTKDTIEISNFDKDIKELKYLISSLKTTLDENKYLYTSEDKSRDENMGIHTGNRNFISINESCNININIKSPNESMIRTFKKSSSTERVSIYG